MKTLFYFLTLQWPTCWRRLFTKKEDIPFLEFEQEDYTTLLVKPRLLHTKRQILKSLKKIRGKQAVSPLGIRVWNGASIYMDDATLLEEIISPIGMSYLKVAVPFKTANKITIELS